MFDLIIRGGTVIDGTGGPGRSADVGITGGEIVAVGDLKDKEAKRVIDAKGLAVSPGAIDMHSHSDLSLPVHNLATSSLLQGITTELVGSCGWSLAPLKKEILDTLVKSLIKALGGPETADRINARWRSFGEYLDTLERKGIGVNIAPLVGQSLIRAHVVGSEKRPPMRGEMEAMKDLLKSCMEEGAFGFSTGRSYMPGGSARTEEIIELAKVLAPYDGIYTSHMKNEGAELLSAVDEVIRIGREAGIKVEVSHHKAIGTENFGRVVDSLAMMDKARKEGVDINADLYPYPFAQVFMLYGMLATEEWEEPDPKKLLEKLKDPAARAALRKTLEDKAKEAGLELSQAIKGSNYEIVGAPKHPELQGKALDEAAKGSGKDVFDFGVDLLIEEEMKVRAAAHMNENDVQTVLRHPLTMVGTDAFAVDFPFSEEAPLHPRHYGTFPRVLGHYTRDVKILSLEEAVAKCTGRPAAKLGLADRGLVKEGYCADLIIFDPATFDDRATGTEPDLPPVGLDWVIVNGQVAVDHGRHTGALAGRVLRRP